MQAYIKQCHISLHLLYFTGTSSGFRGFFSCKETSPIDTYCSSATKQSYSIHNITQQLLLHYKIMPHKINKRIINSFSVDCRMHNNDEQESCALARKTSDVAALLFGLKFADNIHYTFKSSQASKARIQSSKHTATKPNLTQKVTQYHQGHPRSRVLESVERQ